MNFSVVIPAFETCELRYLEKCVESVGQAGKYAQYAVHPYTHEVVVAGRAGGEAGDLFNIFSDRVADDQHIRVVRADDLSLRGVWGAVRAGLTAASGDYVWPLETRDSLLTTSFETQAALLNGPSEYGLVFGRAILEHHGVRIADPNHEDQRVTFTEEPAEFLRLLIGDGGQNRIVNGTAVLSRQVLERMVVEDEAAIRSGLPEIDIAAGDWMMYARAVAAGATYALNPAPVSVHEVYQPGSLERERMERVWKPAGDQIRNAFRTGRFSNVLEVDI